jgi:hypothetical protein
MDPSKTQLIESAFAGGGEMGARMHAFDWSSTALGPAEAMAAIAAHLRAHRAWLRLSDAHLLGTRVQTALQRCSRPRPGAPLDCRVRPGALCWRNATALTVRACAPPALDISGSRRAAPRGRARTPAVSRQRSRAGAAPPSGSAASAESPRPRRRAIKKSTTPPPISSTGGASQSSAQ